MNTPERVKRALAKYNIVDEKINDRIRSAGGAAIELESAYVDIEVIYVYILKSTTTTKKLKLFFLYKVYWSNFYWYTSSKV